MQLVLETYLLIPLKTSYITIAAATETLRELVFIVVFIFITKSNS